MTDLSIIVPIFNCESYLPECVTSIQAEMDEKVELLLIDDGSTDGSLAVSRMFASRNTKVLHHENVGVSETRNLGIEVACGRYVMFVDADDRLIPGWRQVVTEGLLSQTDIVSFHQGSPREPVSITNIVGNIVGFHQLPALRYFAGPVSKVYRRGFLEENDLRFCSELINGEDALFNISAFLAAADYTFIDHSIYQYRIHFASATHRFDEKFYDSNLKYLEELRAILASKDAIPGELVTTCVSYSFVTSMVLILLRISSIQGLRAQREELLRLSRNARYLYLLARFRAPNLCSHSTRLTYWILRHRQFEIALMAVRVARVFKRASAKKKWVRI